MGKGFVPNSKKNNILNFWRSIYCVFLPIVCVIIFIICYKKCNIKPWKSEGFSDTLTSIVTFVSICISFLGVLLTMLISAKEKSKLIKFFIDSADKDYFVSCIKQLIMNGLLTVILAAVLFLEDIMLEWTLLFLFCFGFFTLVRFVALTYRFVNILLMLFIKERDFEGKGEGEKLPEDRKKEMDERIRRGI